MLLNNADEISDIEMFAKNKEMCQLALEKNIKFLIIVSEDQKAEKELLTTTLFRAFSFTA